MLSNVIQADKGIIIAPVVDAVGEPLQTYYVHQAPHVSYKNLPWASYKRDHAACPRLHQLLYHEIIDIIETAETQNDHEIQVTIPHLFYQTRFNHTPQNSCWILKQHIIPLSKIPSSDLEKLPQQIQFNKNNEAAYLNTVTLVEPFADSHLNITFSAGTRFVKTKEQTFKDKVTVYCLHPKKHSIVTLDLPKAAVHIFHPKTMHDRIDDFLTIVRRWAHQKNGIIPYAWGGCSFINTYAQNNFTLEHKSIHGKKLGFYVRPNTKTQKSGYDCSGIILRAAQIAGLPYYCKNTYTLMQQLPSLTANEAVKEGDLIWIYGHVLIVADCKKSTVIEAGSYDCGYGKIQEVPIGKIFKGIETFADLQQRFSEKASVERLTHNGSILDTYKEVKLLKFASQWI
jgi:hypothetical protein